MDPDSGKIHQEDNKNLYNIKTISVNVETSISATLSKQGGSSEKVTEITSIVTAELLFSGFCLNLGILV